MKPCDRILAGIAAVCLPVLALAEPAAASGKNWLRESATVTRQFSLTDASGRRELVIDNVIGAIDVRAGSGDRVELTLKQSWSAENAEEMAEAKREVELEVRETPGKLALVQGGSWRCRGKGEKSGDGDWDGDGGGDCCCNHGWDDRDWEVRYDWTLVVPKNVDLTVKSVNDGAIHIEGVSGKLRVRHVNDDVTVANVAGRVDAKTVNGELKVDFTSLPAGDSTFATVNGDIEIGFPRGLGADLTFATLNGDVYTDFPFTLAKNPPPPPPPTSERGNGRSGKHRHELGRRTAATLGNGGIAIDCDTVNGDIRIRERG
jgi:hypothetical protein